MHEIATVLRCKLCPPANAKAIAGPSGILTPGAPTNRVGEFVKALTEHISTAHPQHHEYLQQKMLEFFGLQLMMQYSTADPGIQYSRNVLRWNIHQATLDARIPDDKLEIKSQEFADELVDLVVTDVMRYFKAPVGDLSFDTRPTKLRITEKVREVFRGIRDVLQEPNAPAPPSTLKF